MSELLTLIRVGDTPRMGSLLYEALAGISYEKGKPVYLRNCDLNTL